MLQTEFLSSKEPGVGTFGPNWEGPYHIKKEVWSGPYNIEGMEGKT